MAAGTHASAFWRSATSIDARSRPVGGVLLAFAWLATVSGCASATLTAGANIAAVGRSAAAQMRQNVELSADSVANLRRAVAFSDGFNKQTGNAASAEFLSNMIEIQGRLGQYRRLLDSLSASYAALGDLASYDASGRFGSSYDTLLKDGHAFASSVGASFDIPSIFAGGIKSAGAAVVGATQAKRVKSASARIQAVLTRVIAILDDAKTRDRLIPAQAIVTGQIDQAAVELFASGVYSYEPLLDALGRPLGLKTADGAQKAVSSNERVMNGLRNIVVDATNERAKAVSASYDRSLDALKALVPLHEKLQSGVPVSLDEIAGITSQLATIAEAMRPESSSSKEGK